MAVKAKMRCGYIQESRNEAGELTGKTVHLGAVYSDDPSHENFEWSKATPAGTIQLSITNPAAYDQFVQGKEYLLTFDPVE
jgi:hypothetical protein